MRMTYRRQTRRISSVWPRWRTALLPASVAVAAGVIPLAAGWPYWFGHQVLAVVAVLMAALLAGAGTLLMLGAGSRKTGASIVAAALLYAVAWLGVRDHGWLPVFGEFAQSAFFLVLGVGIVLNGRGRFDRWWEWGWTALGVTVLIVQQVVAVVASRPQDLGYDEGVWWPHLDVPARVTNLVLFVGSLNYTVLALTFVAVLVARRRLLRGLELRTGLGLVVFSALFAVASALIQFPVMRAGVTFDANMGARAAQGACVIVIPLALLASAMRSRWVEQTVATQLNRLIGYPTPHSVRHGLRVVLRDPELRIWLWIPVAAAFVDADGNVRHPADDNSPDLVEFGDEDGLPLVLCRLDPTVFAHQGLLQVVFEQCVPALQAVQLQVTRLEELRETQYRLLEAEREGHRKLARDLHDGVQQTLIAVTIDLSRIARSTTDPDMRADVAAAGELVSRVLTDVREIADGLHPLSLRERGLGGALAEAAARFGIRTSVNVTTTNLRPHLELALYYVLSEALTNVARHARAQSVRIDVHPVGNTMVGEVTDDGIGGAIVQQGHGLHGAFERVKAMRGRCELQSLPDRGTRLTVVLPAAEVSS